MHITADRRYSNADRLFMSKSTSEIEKILIDRINIYALARV